MRRRRARAGFTIIEVVLATFVLLLGATSILALLSFGAALARNAELRSEGSLAAEAVLADLEERLFPLERAPSGELVAGAPEPVRGRAVPGHPKVVYSAVPTPIPAPDGGEPRAYRIDLELSWTGGGAGRGRRFTALLAREVPFGERLRRMAQRGVETASEGPDRTGARAEEQEHP